MFPIEPCLRFSHICNFLLLFSATQVMMILLLLTISIQKTHKFLLAKYFSNNIQFHHIVVRSNIFPFFQQYFFCATLMPNIHVCSVHNIFFKFLCFFCLLQEFVSQLNMMIIYICGIFFDTNFYYYISVLDWTHKHLMQR